MWHQKRLKKMVYFSPSDDSVTWWHHQKIKKYDRTPLTPYSNKASTHSLLTVSINSSDGTCGTTNRLCTSLFTLDALRSHRMAEWVEHPSPILVEQGLNSSNWWDQTLIQSNQWLKNVFLSLPWQALDIIRLGQGLVDTVPGCYWFGLPRGQHDKVVMSVHCHKPVPVLTLDVARM